MLPENFGGRSNTPQIVQRTRSSTVERPVEIPFAAAVAAFLARSCERFKTCVGANVSRFVFPL